MTFDEAYDIDASISPKPNGALVRANHRWSDRHWASSCGDRSIYPTDGI